MSKQAIETAIDRPFETWTPKKDQDRVRKDYLAYCEQVVTCVPVLHDLHVALIRACRQLPALQAIALPYIVENDLWMEIFGHPEAKFMPESKELPLKEVATALLSILPKLPALTVEVREANRKLLYLAMDEVDSKNKAVADFARSHTGLSAVVDAEEKRTYELLDLASE